MTIMIPVDLNFVLLRQQFGRYLFGYVDVHVAVHAGMYWSSSRRINANVVGVDPRSADVRRLLEGYRLERLEAISEVP